MRLFIKHLPPIWIYRFVRWAFSAFFISIGLLYEDAWAAFIFGGIFLVTSFFKPTRCLGTDCSFDKKSN